MQNRVMFTKEQKYQMALFGILVLSSLISIGLFSARIPPSPHGPYTSLVLNLILAWTPLLFAWIVYKFIYSSKPLIRALVSICAIFWLLFFPNSLYILTDFEHIRLIDTPTPVWYDVIMLLWFSWSGVFLGAASLTLMQNVVTRRLGKIRGWVFTGIAIILASLGVYIGRFIQVNSWDLIINPLRIFALLREHIFYPQYRSQAVGYFFLFSLFFSFAYMMLYIFGQLMQEQGQQE